jgi:hypothetical protein
MSRLEQLEQQVAELDASELKALRAWFERYDAEVWDRQIESDAKSGKLGRLTSGRASDSCLARFSVRQTSHLSFSKQSATSLSSVQEARFGLVCTGRTASPRSSCRGSRRLFVVLV